MKLVLVNPPRSFLDRSEIAPPLGLMRLAQAARCVDIDVTIIDLNHLYHTDDRLQGIDTFYAAAIDRLLEEKGMVYCFTSMAVDSHVAIHLARLLKKKRPEVVIAVGGTHFSSISNAVVDRLPWIDFVVTGEGENFVLELPKFVREKSSQKVVKGQPFTGDMVGGLPFELLDLDQYFLVNPNRCLDFESGRGCRFKCAFCYSPQHYDGFRNFEIDRTIAGLEEAAELGFRNVFFVEDNFLNHPSRARDLCKELEGARCNLSWQAYVTFPQLTGEIISTMARAGCSAVFAGIDAVGAKSRRLHKKSFVRDAIVLQRRIHECVDNSIIPTCAFLLSPPSYPGGSDIDETLFFALAARNAGARVRLNTLTLYNQTGTYLANASRPEHDEFKVRLMLDVPEVVERNFYALENPELFPFHSRYVGADEWQNFVSTVHCLFTLFEAYPRTIQNLSNSCGIPPLEIAKKVLDNTAPLLDIPKVARRDAELLAAVVVLEGAASKYRSIHSELELESERLLAFNE